MDRMHSQRNANNKVGICPNLDCVFFGNAVHLVLKMHFWAIQFGFLKLLLYNSFKSGVCFVRTNFWCQDCFPQFPQFLVSGLLASNFWC